MEEVKIVLLVEVVTIKSQEFSIGGANQQFNRAIKALQDSMMRRTSRY
jgi:hypothetical protein